MNSWSMLNSRPKVRPANTLSLDFQQRNQGKSMEKEKSLQQMVLKQLDKWLAVEQE